MTEREGVRDLMTEYGSLIDSNELEKWLDLFSDKSSYQIISRENIDQGLSQALIYCDTKDMIIDRVTSYRKVNEYNLHTDCHVIGSIRFVAQDDPVWKIEASYSLYQTNLEGVSRLFSVGRYHNTVVFEDGQPRFRDVKVVVETAAIPTLLATPI